MISVTSFLMLALFASVSWYSSGLRLFPKPGFGPPRLTGPMRAGIALGCSVDVGVCPRLNGRG